MYFFVHIKNNIMLSTVLSQRSLSIKIYRLHDSWALAQVMFMSPLRSLRPGVAARLCLRLHRRHLRGGPAAGLRLPLLPPLSAAARPDHQGVVLVAPAL